jgi:hypothetical protein
MAIDWNPLSWFSGGGSNWLGDIGGGIASGVEGGFVAFFRDLWAFLLPFFEIFIGVVVLILVFGYYFKDDIKAVYGSVLGIASQAATLAV